MASAIERIMPGEEARLSEVQISSVRYAFASKLVEGKSVLDVACGSGYGSSYLLNKGARMVIGGDISAVAIEAARRFYKKEGAEFVLLDATRLPFHDNSFEAVVSIETIEHLRQYEEFLSECRRVLKERGIFICSTLNRGMGIPDVKPGIYHAQEFLVEELQELLSQFFKGVEIYGMDYWHKGEKEKFKRRYRIEQVLKPLVFSLPKHDEIVRFYRRFILGERFTKFGPISDFDKALIEKYKPFPLVSGSPVPKWMIAVGRKEG